MNAWPSWRSRDLACPSSNPVTLHGLPMTARPCMTFQLPRDLTRPPDECVTLHDLPVTPWHYMASRWKHDLPITSWPYLASWWKHDLPITSWPYMASWWMHDLACPSNYDLTRFSDELMSLGDIWRTSCCFSSVVSNDTPSLTAIPAALEDYIFLWRASSSRD